MHAAAHREGGEDNAEHRGDAGAGIDLSSGRWICGRVEDPCEWMGTSLSGQVGGRSASEDRWATCGKQKGRNQTCEERKPEELTKCNYQEVVHEHCHCDQSLQGHCPKRPASVLPAHKQHYLRRPAQRNDELCSQRIGLHHPVHTSVHLLLWEKYPARCQLSN